jgi:U3 small nucleolar ribonucleoprotein protein IMP3
MRELKFHEKKLLKKVDFLRWSTKDAGLKEIAVLRRYHVQNREDYAKYNKIVGQVQKLIAKLKALKSSDQYRIMQSEAMVAKLYDMGVITSRQGLGAAEKVNVSAFCRRRLPVIMHKLKMAETVKEAVMFIEQGHVRVGVETITDPAFHVNRVMEDHVTWVKNSNIRKKILKYNDKYDDFDLVE